MAGTIIADYIRTDANKLSLNVGNTTFATINAMGLLSNTGVQIINQNGLVTLADGQITAAKLADSSVTPAKVASGMVRKYTARTSVAYAAGNSVSRVGTGHQLVAGYSCFHVAAGNNSNYVLKYGAYCTGGGARFIVKIWARKSTTPLGVYTLDSETVPKAASLTTTLVSTDGWTELTTFGASSESPIYFTGDAPRNAVLYVPYANMPSHVAGDSLQFAVSIGNDTGGYTTTLVMSGNTTSLPPYLEIMELA
jgi:hypothetical protein